jgi:transposase
MSLKCMPIPPIPDETVRVAHAAFPYGTLLMQIREGLGTLYSDEDFADLFPSHGQPAEGPWRLALVRVFQFVEGLSDRQAADAVRSHVGWKYASVLSEFRSRLLTGDVTQLLLGRMRERLHAHGLLKPRGQARTDSTHILAAIRTSTSSSA